MDILKKKINKTLLVEINRPKKLNSLSYEAIKILDEIADEVNNDDDICLVIVEGAGEKAFCAGGDIREVYENYLVKGDINPEFFHDEFVMDEKFSKLKKPVIAHWKGYVMGGGVGLSMGFDFKVCDETTRWAMPEADLGIIPDVGSGYYFSKIDRDKALYLSLLGHIIEGPDLMRLGFATDFINRSDWDEIKEEILKLDCSDCDVKEEIKNILSKYKRDLYETEFQKDEDKIKKYFDKKTLLELIENLDEDDKWAGDVKAELLKKCPKSLFLIFDKYEVGKNLSLSETYKLDEKILLDAMADGNMKEGIRAKLVDKDNAPKFNPESIHEVDQKKIMELLKI